MFVAAAVVALGILGINVLMNPTLVGKPREPIDGGDVVFATILTLVLSGAVYELWHSTQPAYGLAVASVLWGANFFTAVVTVGQIGKPREPITAADAVGIFLLGLAATGMVAYLVFA